MKFSIIATIVVAVFAQSAFKFQIHSPHFLACVVREQTCIELIPSTIVFVFVGALAAPSPKRAAARDALPAAEVRLFTSDRQARH